VHWFFLILLYPISWLPLRVLYFFSDGLYIVLFKFFSYRKDVVMDNLSKSFPEKNSKELEELTKVYYRNLCDSIVETIKLLSITEKELNNRMVCNWEILEGDVEGNRIGQAYLSHQFNWEWGTVVANYNMQPTFTGVYLPLSSNAFEKVMQRIRTSSGTQIIPVQQLMEKLGDLQKQDIAWGFIADQNPSDPRRCLWTDFFNRKTAFAKGAEFVARRYNNKVYFGEIIKLKRGYYEIKLKLAFENPSATKDGEITEAYVRFLEASIKRQPENWVWSHRRWKHIYPTQ
jgi:Kdo2-lipid IVA lauroyltransferase/acyltransferase